MIAPIENRLNGLLSRSRELDQLLADPAVLSDLARYKSLSQEYAQLQPALRAYAEYRSASERRRVAEALRQDGDADLQELVEEELRIAQALESECDLALQRLLLPRDPNDARDLFLELRAGTGGDEAALFAGDLCRMYLRYAERCGWSAEIVSDSPGEHGGHKEIIVRIAGENAYSRLKFESGAHRVQRVPATEAQGRIHTSTCTVAVLPEVAAVDAVEINPADLRIDTYRASGAGGQHVNKTDSAIRITHLPTGTAVECQDERSQHKNRARAMSLLKARLLNAERAKQASAQAAARKSLVGTGDRSERIRTYNFPQGRVTDHRINLTLYRLEAILLGDIELIIEPLVQAYQAEQLAALGESNVD